MLEVDDNVIEQVTEENTSAETDDIGTSADILQEDSAEADESAESQENDAATQSQETVSQPRASRNIRMRASKNSAIPEA